MIEYITTKNTAKLVREALKREFPGVKFSVRMSTGTAAAWMDVTWCDGPTTLAVDSITARYHGRKFNGMTDSYDDQGTALIAFGVDALPVEVSYCCDGINSQRNYSAQGYALAQHLIATDSDNCALVLFTREGEMIPGATVPMSFWVAGHFHENLYSAIDLAQRILRRVPVALPAKS